MHIYIRIYIYIYPFVPRLGPKAQPPEPMKSEISCGPKGERLA